MQWTTCWFCCKRDLMVLKEWTHDGCNMAITSVCLSVEPRGKELVKHFRFIDVTKTSPLCQTPCSPGSLPTPPPPPPPPPPQPSPNFLAPQALAVEKALSGKKHYKARGEPGMWLILFRGVWNTTVLELTQLLVPPWSSDSQSWSDTNTSIVHALTPLLPTSFNISCSAAWTRVRSLNQHPRTERATRPWREGGGVWNLGKGWGAVSWHAFGSTQLLLASYPALPTPKRTQPYQPPNVPSLTNPQTYPALPTPKRTQPYQPPNVPSLTNPQTYPALPTPKRTQPYQPPNVPSLTNPQTPREVNLGTRLHSWLHRQENACQATHTLYMYNLC